MECIDDWEPSALLLRAARRSKAAVPPALPALGWAGAIFGRVRQLPLPITSVHCYVDVGYPWVRVMVDDGAVLTPAHALAIGDGIEAGVAPLGGEVLFHSLQPQAVSCIVVPQGAAAGRPLPPDRYGTALSALRAAWQPAA